MQDELKFYKTTKYVPFNPVDKITIATVLDSRTNKKFRVLKGSPQVSEWPRRSSLTCTLHSINYSAVSGSNMFPRNI